MYHSGARWMARRYACSASASRPASFSSIPSVFRACAVLRNVSRTRRGGGWESARARRSGRTIVARLAVKCERQHRRLAVFDPTQVDEGGALDDGRVLLRTAVREVSGMLEEQCNH